MNYPLPHTIQNCQGEVLTFKALVKEPDGDRLLVENYVKPNSGPPMHTHFLQDEALTVVRGKMAYQVLGGELSGELRKSNSALMVEMEAAGLEAR